VFFSFVASRVACRVWSIFFWFAVVPFLGFFFFLPPPQLNHPLVPRGKNVTDSRNIEAAASPFSCAGSIETPA